MSVEAIYDALASYLQPDGEGGEQIDLVAASADPALDGLGATLTVFGISGSFVLTEAVLSQPTGDSVRLTGQGSYGAPDAATTQAVTGTLDGSAPGGSNFFALALAMQPTDWTFSSFFPTLPQCQSYDEDSQTVTWVDSFLIGLPLAQPVFSGTSEVDAPLQLSGDLSPDGALAAYAALFPSWPLHLSGTVVLGATTADPPVLDLRAVSATATIAFGDTQVQQVGLRLWTQTDLDELESPQPAVSYLDLIGSLYFGSSPSPLTLSVPLLATSQTWRLLVQAEPGEYRVGDQIAAVAAILGLPVSGLVAPPGLDVFNDFYLVEVEFAIPPLTSLGGPAPTASHIAVTLASDRVWAPPIPFVRVRDVGMRWLVGYLADSDGGTPYTSGAVWGGVTIGPDMPPTGGPVLQPPDPPPQDPSSSFTVEITAYVPEFVVLGNLKQDDTIPIGDAFRHFFGDPGPPTPNGMAVTSFQFEAGPLTRTFNASATITTDWTLQLTDTVAITMIGLSFEIDVSQSSVYGGIMGTILLVGGSHDPEAVPEFYIGAEYRSSGSSSGWIFNAQLAGQNPVSLDALVINLLGIDPAPAGLPSLDIVAMGWRYETESLAYWAAGTIAARWVVEVFGSTLNLSATASAEISRPDGSTDPSGTLSGSFSVNRLSLTVQRDIGVTEPTYLFQVQFGDLWLRGVTSWTGDSGNRHQVITVQLGGVTLGQVLEYLVNLAAPTLGFQLDPPWDVLNQVELSRFELLVDPTDNVVQLTYRVDMDIVVMRIDRIGVRYALDDGVGSVNLVLEGNFLGTDYTGDDALEWDVVRDPPPAVPGQNETLIDLRYIGVGQRVTFSDTSDLNTVRETLDRLRQEMRPPRSTGENPLDNSALVFSPDSEWLLGLDIGLMETVDLGIVFNDPVLYGLYIQLGGEKAGGLAGLYFEILYKKITDTVGMFRIELRLPEVFRHIEMGEVSITLGVIVVEIYTNGNFLVDFGFPYERNFDRSFSVEVFPFLGRGGIYFGVLDGDTSRRVPKITNGNFAPVLELGVGLAVGVGKDISVGPLSGGIYVQVEVLFQGVLAWFNPTSSGAESAQYYQVQGVAAIHGKLYGSVDFKVIKVSVNLEAYAEASVVLESYQPTVFRLAVGVTVEAKVKVLFVTVHFSFDVDLDTSFTVGSAAATPWIVDAGAAGGAESFGSLRLSYGSQVRQLRQPQLTRRALRQQHLRLLQRHRTALAAGAAAEEEVVVLNWDPTQQVLSQPSEPVPMTLLPAFSAADIPLAWNGTAPANDDPSYQVAMLLFADNGIDPAAATVAETLERSADHSAHADDPAELPATTVVEAFLRWAIFAVTNPVGSTGSAPTTVTAGQMDVLLAEMNDTETVDGGFAIANLETFFGTNMLLQISGDPGGDPTGYGGLAVAVPPALTLNWQGDGSGTVDFATQTPVGALYEQGAAAYMASFSTYVSDGDGGEGGDGDANGAGTDDPADYESFATFIFRDWCLMITKAGVQAADDEMQSWALETSAASDLAALAGDFPQVSVEYRVRAGDTVAHVAQVLGVTTAEISYLNPHLQSQLDAADAGAEVSVVLGVAPEILALDNPQLALTAGTYDLGDLEYQIRSGDTFDSIAQRFDFASASALFSNTLLAEDRQVLAADASFPTQQATWTLQTGFDVLLSAAAFFVRFTTPADIPDGNWYAQTVFDWNQSQLADVSIDGQLPPDLALQAPSALGSTDQSAAITYTTVPGDTVQRIGAALSLDQNYGTVSSGPVPGWPEFRDGVQASGSSAVSLPASTMTVQLGETPDALAQRTILFGATSAGGDPDIDGLLDWIGDQPILDSLGVVELPSYSVDTSLHTTFAAIADAFGLDVGSVGGRLANAQNLIPDGSALVVTRLPVQDIDTLVQRVLAGPLLSQVSGMSSRFLLAGLQLPAPEDDGSGHTAATGPLTSILDLSGQQFPGPKPPEGGEGGGDTALTMSLRVNEGTSWIQLMDSQAVEDLELLLDQRPEIRQLNRRLAAGGPAGGTAPAAQGMIVLVGEAESLEYSYTNAQLAALYPTPSLGLDPTQGPASLPLATEVPRTYGLDQRAEVQTPVPLAIPQQGTASLAGNPSLWPFSVDLEARAREATSTPWEIVRTEDPGSAGGAEDAVLLDATFATVIELVVQKLEALGGVYELVGSTTTTSQTLLALWQYLAEDGHEGAQASVLVAPSPDAGNTSGWTVLDTDAAATYLLKTNLSTETVPGLPEESAQRLTQRAVEDTQTTWTATLGDLAAFLTLLWEGTVVGGKGYFLGFATTAGEALPASLFDDRGRASVRLLVIPAAQQSVAPQGRPLLPFNNCALVDSGLDPAVQSLFVETADDSELMAAATVPPGNVGLTLTLPKPPATSGEQADIYELYSLAKYAVGTSADTFYDPLSGPPVTPEAVASGAVEAWRRRRLQRRALARGETLEDPALDSWLYQQVIPVSRMGPASQAPAVPGLPAPAADPYRGIGGRDELTDAQIQLGFGDILGNQTAAPAAGDTSGLVAAPVGYTDALRPVTGWPGLVSTYDFRSEPTGAALDLGFSLQPGTLAMGLLQPAALAAEAAARTAESYSEIYYQVVQPDLKVRAWTTLVSDDEGVPERFRLDDAGIDLWRFAGAAHAAATTTAALEPVRPFAAAAGTLSQLQTDYGVDLATVAAANAEQEAAAVLGSGTLVMPAFGVFVEGSSATALAANPQPGWPSTTADKILSDSLNSAQLPLRPAIALSTPAATVDVGTGSPTPTLAQLAVDHHTSPALLAGDNAADASILQEGFEFVADEQAVTVDAAGTPDGVRSFDDVVSAFADLGVQRSVGDLATENSLSPGMFESGATLTSLHYLVPEAVAGAAPKTLADNDSGFTVDQLAQANVDTVDIWDAGALVYLGDFDPAPTAEGTIRQLVDRYGTTPALFFAALASEDFELPAGSALVAPGMAAFPTDADALRVPYTLRSSDTLSAVAGRFAYPEAAEANTQLATDNGAMPDVLVAGVQISVTVIAGTAQTTTEAGDSLDDVLGRLQAQVSSIDMGDLASSIADTTDLLLAGGLFLCPPALLPAAATTPDGVPGVYTVSAESFAQANQAVRGLVASGVQLTADDPQGNAVQVTTVADDTFNAVTARFAAAGAQTSPGQIVSDNSSAALFRSGAQALLPPTPFTLTADLGTVGSTPFPGPVFALEVALQLQRPRKLVNPEFRTVDRDGAVERAESRIPSPVSPQYQGATGVSLDAFAASFMTTFPELRLGTGRVAGEPSELWVVVFTTGGVTDFTVAPGVSVPGGLTWPRYFAIRPLYTELIHRSVRLEEVQADGTLVPAVRDTDLQGIDAEVWAESFLAAVDLFLAAPYGPALQAAAPAALTSVLESKRQLVEGISAGLAPLLQLTDSQAAAGRAAAEEELAQHLGISLSKGYDTDVLLQYDATVASAWTAGTLPPARLDGDARIPDAGGVGADPGYSLTNAKTPLAETSSFVTFLMTVDDVETTTDVAIDPEYELTHLEFNIQPVAVDPQTTYEASDWLTMVPALAGADKPAVMHTDLGSATVPVPLRYYPATPVLKGQQAAADIADPALDQAPDWRHGVTYSHEHAAQDEVLLTTSYNLEDGAGELMAEDDPPDVAAALAIYQNAADDLWQLLGYYADPSAGEATSAANAAASFAQLVGDVASAWQGYWAAVDAGAGAVTEDAPASASFQFRLRLTYSGETIESLVIEALQAQPGPVGQWPYATYTAPSGRVVDLGQGSGQGDQRVYDFPTDEPVPAAAWAQIGLEWRGLSTATQQNASVTLSVQRNRELLPPGQPQIPTSEAFVFSTATVSAPGLATPLNQWSEPFDITSLGATVEAALQAAFQQLFGDAMDGQPVTIQLSYGFQLVAPGSGDPEGLRTFLPVALYPNQTLDNTTAATLSQALAAWQQAQSPQTAGGAWLIGLTQFSQLSSTSGSHRALLNVQEMVYRLS
ncbi:MAG: hypothetical protein SX243_07080 [Acidobacteriota bacterium]|nr:hypothetical protein [Acidobacteriota bacterium]